MDNSAGCATAIYGTLLAGGVFVVVNPQTKEDKLLYVLDDCEAAAVLTEGSLTRTALAAAASAAEREGGRRRLGAGGRRGRPGGSTT